MGLLTLIDRLINQYQADLDRACDLVTMGRAQGAKAGLKALVNGCESYLSEYERKVEIKRKETNNE